MSAIDSLPYYDRDLDTLPSLRHRIKQDITTELLKSSASTSTPSASALQHLPLHPSLTALSSSSSTSTSPSLATPPPQLDSTLYPLSTSSLHHYLTNSNSDQNHNPPPSGLDTSRFSLSSPPPHDPDSFTTTNGKGNVAVGGASVEEWEKCVNNAASQVEHQRSRLDQLRLMLSTHHHHDQSGQQQQQQQQQGSGQCVAANAWKCHNFLVEKHVKNVQGQVEQVKERVDDLNRQRKSSQMEAGQILNSLETRWTELISTNIQLEIANVTLQNEVDQLRQRQEYLLSQLAATE